ncbi:hypothetical protein SEVIR_4G304600v4 [Setaria viridis]|uniref:Uncharacterized protein n=1 Tax=Setaria viridis TaxID=4556 RepID=A0A4U6V3L5_SETVI|nr:hypothetical protein SEVIR_4G304600v2 [Setaria viridis]
MTTQQPGRHKAAAVVVVCLQAQHVAGLPAAAEGRQVLLRLFQQPATRAVAAAAAVCGEGGVAAFHDQVLLLDCAPPVSSIVGVAVTVDDDGRRQHGSAAAVDVNLAEQLRRPSPRVLSFVIGGGAVLSLTLHHRLVAQRRRRHSVSGCNCMAADLLLSCLRVPLPTGGPPPPAAGGGVGVGHHHDDESSSSSGFITIEKGTISISRQRPPSDNMLTTDDEGEEEDIRKVEDEFLAMLNADDLLDLDALIKDAEAELMQSIN